MKTFRRFAFGLLVIAFTLLSLAFVAAGVYVAFKFGYEQMYRNNKSLADIGQFLSGTTAALWSLAGFFIVFVAFLLQWSEMKGNEEVAILERFQSHFFQLLTLHQEIVKDETLRTNNHEQLKGRRCFNAIYYKFNTDYPDFSLAYSKLSTREKIQKFYSKMYNDNYEPQLGHYFRNLYHIVKFVDESELQDKKRYMKILRAQLSSNELLLLFYNGLTEVGRRHFKKLIEDYALLEPMPMHELLDSSHESEYSPSAYKDN